LAGPRSEEGEQRGKDNQCGKKKEKEGRGASTTPNPEKHRGFGERAGSLAKGGAAD